MYIFLNFFLHFLNRKDSKYYMRNCDTAWLFLYNFGFTEEIYKNGYENKDLKQNKGNIF